MTAFAAVPDGGGPAGDPPSAPDTSVTWKADRFATGLYGLAELAREQGGLPALLHSEDAVRILEAVCHGPRALPAAQGAQVNDLLAVTDRLELALRPLSLDWYGDRRTPGLGGVDLCHATSGGAAALPGLLAKRFFGTPLLVTEYGVRLREHYLARAAAPLSVPVRALLAAFQGALAAETYAQAALITPGNTHARRWQERCGADRARLRTVYPGMDAAPFAAVADAAPDDSTTLVWVGTVEPAKDLIALLHAFAEVRRAEPAATLRIIGGRAATPGRPGISHTAGRWPPSSSPTRRPTPAPSARTRSASRRSAAPTCRSWRTPMPPVRWWCSPASSRAFRAPWWRRCSAAAPRCRPTPARSAKSSAAPVWSSRRATPARWPRPAQPCSPTPTAGPGWARRPAPGRWSCSPSSRTSRHFVASTWS